MMNIQDLATVALMKLPITIFILDNDGYHSIRQTQNNFFPNRTIGCGKESGLLFPNFESIGKGFGIKSMTIENNEKLIEQIPDLIKEDEPIICVLKLDISIPFRPKVSSKKLSDGSMQTARLEDMSPFLPSEIHHQILHCVQPF